VIGTEAVSAVCTRGIYITDSNKGFVSSYDPYTTTSAPVRIAKKK
jgi:beta-galactosidase